MKKIILISLIKIILTVKNLQFYMEVILKFLTLDLEKLVITRKQAT